MTEHWIVVGAGSAGCVVANRLSADPDRAVTLLDDGPDLTPATMPPAVEGASFLDALAEPDRVHADVVASRTTGGAVLPYLRGRGVGGSSVVNAMIGLRGSASCYRRWGWNDTEAMWDRVQIPTERAAAEELGPVDRALLASDDRAEVAPLTRRDGRRVTSAEAYLWPVTDRANLVVRPDSEVDRLVLAGRRVTGVLLADGTTLDSDRVVLCAGAIHTPAIMLRSGLDTPGVGRGLQDHPSMPLTLRLRTGVEHRPSQLVVGSHLSDTFGRRRTGMPGSFQILPMNHLGPDPALSGLGLLMPALMTPRGNAGTVRLDSDGRPVVDFAFFDGAADVDALACAVRLTLELLRRPSFRDIVEEVLIDESGTTASVLDDDAMLSRWIREHPGDYVHASGTCGMGTVVDEAGAVHGYTGLSVCDASVFPEIPDANTHLPVTLAAERLCVRGRMF